MNLQKKKICAVAGVFLIVILGLIGYYKYDRTKHMAVETTAKQISSERTTDNQLSIKLQNELFAQPYYNVKCSQFDELELKQNEKPNIVFLGDSITDFGCWDEIIDDDRVNVYNRGISGDTALGVQKRLPAIAKLHPTKVFVLIGINNLAVAQTLDVAIDDYKAMVGEIQRTLPDSEIYLQSILPINNTVYINEHITDNKEIVRYNTAIQQIAADHGYSYINLYDSFTDENGKLNLSYSYDGCHLNVYGYQLWKRLIQDYL